MTCCAANSHVARQGSINKATSVAFSHGEKEMSMKLWRYNPITGYWVFVRECADENAEAWLVAFMRDEPDELFRLAKRRPK